MDKDMYFYNIVDCNIFIMENDMNYKKIIIDSMDCIIGNDKFYNRMCSVDYRNRPTLG